MAFCMWSILSLLLQHEDRWGQVCHFYNCFPQMKDCLEDSVYENIPKLTVCILHWAGIIHQRI